MGVDALIEDDWGEKIRMSALRAANQCWHRQKAYLEDKIGLIVSCLLISRPMTK